MANSPLPTPFVAWITKVNEGLLVTDRAYPFLPYGTDWLAFGHLVIALFFVGPFVDPVRNSWVVRAGMIACLLVIPTALICGQVRGIPLPLWLAHRSIRQLETANQVAPLSAVTKSTHAS